MVSATSPRRSPTCTRTLVPRRQPGSGHRAVQPGRCVQGDPEGPELDVSQRSRAGLRGPGARPSPSACRVQRLVEELVGASVLVALDVADRPLRRGPAARPSPGVERAQVLLLHLPVARAPARRSASSRRRTRPRRPQLLRELDPEQQRAVLGDVVGRLADRLAALGRAPPAGRSVATAAIAAGPGLPREPPSTLTTTFRPALPPRSGPPRSPSGRGATGSPRGGRTPSCSRRGRR